MSFSIWLYVPPDRSPLVLGGNTRPDGYDGGVVHIARSLDAAQRWARDLRAGRLPTGEATDGPTP